VCRFIFASNGAQHRASPGSAQGYLLGQVLRIGRYREHRRLAQRNRTIHRQQAALVQQQRVDLQTLQLRQIDHHFGQPYQQLAQVVDIALYLIAVFTDDVVNP
jgi:hypothetical protein